MSREGSYARLQVDVHMNVEIDGQPALLTGQGDQLILTLGGRKTLHRLLDSDSAIAGQVADALAGMGLTLTVSDQTEPLVEAGYGVSSLVGGLVTGSRHVSPTSLSSLVKVARGYLSTRRR